jgi:hypothetical protein
MLVYRAVVAAGLLALWLSPAWSQTAPDPFERLTTVYNQLKGTIFYALNSCDRLQTPRKEECKDFYQRSLHNLDDRIRAVDDWRAATKENNKPAVWEARIKLAEAELVGREQAKELWQRNFFGAKWNPQTIRPLTFDGYKNEMNNAIYMRDNFCRTMQTDADTCRQDWDKLVTDLQDVITASVSSNQALQDGDRDRYNDAWVEQQRLVVKEIRSERTAKQKYMGQ